MRRRPGRAGGGVNLELERILREANDDDDSDGEDGCTSGSKRNNHRHDSYLLQSILNEAEDEDEDIDEPLCPPSPASLRSTLSLSGSGRSSRRRPSSFPAKPMPGDGNSGRDLGDAHLLELEAILNDADADDDDRACWDGSGRVPRRGCVDDGDGDGDGDVGLNFNFSGGGARPLTDAGYEDSIALQYPLRDRDRNGEGQDPATGITAVSGPYRRSDQARDASSRDRQCWGEAPPNARDERCMTADDEKEDTHYSALRLQRAEADEHRLLRPNTRSVVSPLAVKRRMKPKLELMTKSRRTNQQTVASHQSLQQNSDQQKSHNSRFDFSGGIIQSKSMTALGSQLLQGGNGADSGGRGGGLPTALAVNSKFIAVGNQRGQVWVFDLFEQLKTVLGEVGSSALASVGNGGEGGGGGNNAPSNTVTVTSIDLSLHGDFLLAGYTNGHIVLYDIIKSVVLKRIAELHTSSISSVRFTAVPMTGAGGRPYSGAGGGEVLSAVSVDARGLVNKLVLSRGRLWSSAYTAEAECLLDGTAGQILAMDALPPLDLAGAHSYSRGVSPRRPGDPAADYHPSVHQIVLIALSSGRSSFAVSVEPRVGVLHRWARPAAAQIDIAATAKKEAAISADGLPAEVIEAPVPPCLPCLSWGWALVSGGGHLVTPVLARAWGRCLQFLRANFPPCNEENGNDAASDEEAVHWPAFGAHDEFDASAPVVALNWLGKRSLVYLTLMNELTIIDTVIMTMQERLDFSGMKLVYAEFALCRVPQKLKGSLNKDSHSNSDCTTFMNSIRSSDNRLLILCQSEIKESKNFCHLSNVSSKNQITSSRIPFLVTVLGMREQIMSLEESGQWLEALALALDHYESTVTSQEDKCRRYASSSSALDHLESVDPSLLTEDEIWMAELLMRYLILAIDNAPDTEQNNILNRGSLNLAESHFEMLSGELD